MCVLFQLVVYNDDKMIKILNDVFIAEKQFHTLVANLMSLRTEFVNNLFKDN